MTTKQSKTIYEQLSAPFPDEAVERTKASVTRKGYDTAGIKYQYIVNRLNEVLDVGGFRTEHSFDITEGETRNGYPRIEAVCDIRMTLGRWEKGQWVVTAEACGTGGHVSGNLADAKKGAYTNGFKKVAAMFGCGWQAYAGTLDDDNTPADESAEPPKPLIDRVLAAIAAAKTNDELTAAGKLAKGLSAPYKAKATKAGKRRRAELAAAAECSFCEGSRAPGEKCACTEPAHDPKTGEVANTAQDDINDAVRGLLDI